ncbi:TonB-dependent receptor [Sphingomonas sp. GB1N7]|uniref:TonB-dependent receptor n=1 Tax=Parasphingomonas caseinilytica TaxID=3096158 RepID=UPI002FC65078
MRIIHRTATGKAEMLAVASIIALTISGHAAAQEAAPATPAQATIATAPAPQDDGGLQEIVVTAQKRSENVQSVPIAISAFTSTALQERAVGSVVALSNLAPNVTLDAGSPFSGSSSVLAAYARGIGSNDFAFNIDPGVGVYLDGVYLARSVGANQDLGDVERIEILKGPQGTLFGRNTIGGAISIVTHDPGDKFRVVGDLTTGSYRLLQARGTVDIPFTDTLRSSISFSLKKRDGYLKRLPFPGSGNYAEDPITNFRAAGYYGGGRDTEGGDDTWSVRGKLKWDNGGPLSVTLAGDYTNVDQSQIANKVITTTPAVFAGTYNCAIAGQTTNCGGGPPSQVFGLPRGGQTSILDLAPIFGVNTDANPFNNRLPYDNRFITNDIDTSYASGNNFSKLKSYGGAATIAYDLADTVTLKSITAYRELHFLAGVDDDGSPLNFYNLSFDMNQKQFSQELQLLGTALDKKLNYVLGGYYFKESGNLHDYVTFAEGLLQVDGPNALLTKNYAAFGQIDYRPIDLIGITVGGRYTHEEKTFEGAQSDNNGLTYKVLNVLGVPPCANIAQISEACRIAAGFPNPGQPLRYYIAGVNRKTFSNFSPKLGVQVHPTDDIMVYGSWSKGYKTGGWTTRLSNPLPFAPDFNEEKATTYEAGVKSELLDRHLQLNIAAFTTAYNGIQLNFQQGVSPVIQNAGNARIKGFEIEAVAAPVRGLTINAAIGYLDARYTSVLAGAIVPGDATQAGVFKGATLPKTPRWKINVGPRYQVVIGNGGKIVALASWTHSTGIKNDTEGTFLLNRPVTDVFDASIGYTDPGDHWSLTVGGTNISNERYLTTGQAQIAGGLIYGTYNRPAEWSARLGFKF